MSRIVAIATSMRMFLRILYIIFLCVAFSGCGNNTKKPAGEFNNPEGVISYAKRFTLKTEKGYTILNIKDPWQGAVGISLVYYLVKRGNEMPEGIDSSSIIYVPVNKIICTSTTHLAMIMALHEEKTIAGMSGTGFIYSETLHKNVEKGLIEDVGYDSNLNRELILKISPDLIMMYGVGSESAGYVDKIKELGTKVIFNADYLETDPLGKVEWIKLFGALYCREKMADSIYNSELDSYNRIKSYIEKNISERPKVLLGLPFKDTWYISPGNSYISRLISDAGGDYLWQNTKSAVSLPYGIENVYLHALTADYWLNIGSVRSKDDISGFDPRLKDLPCFKSGKMFNNNKRITNEGGNDYWESGSLYPHVIIKDIASILHPGLFKDYDLFYYRKIN